MVIVYHQNNKVVEVQYDGKRIDFEKLNIPKALFKIADSYSDQLIIWCHIDLKSDLNLSGFPEVFHHNKIMASYNVSDNLFLTEAIGYIEESLFIKINKKIIYPTWQISSDVGGVHASVLRELNNEIQEDINFDYFLHSMAKLAMSKGLFCYSAPQLINKTTEVIQKDKGNKFLLFRFVKQHYRARWTLLLFLNLFLYEKKIALLPFLSSFFYSRRTLKGDLDKIAIKSTNKVCELETIDVIIPTIGRKEVLYDVLKDLSSQSNLPVNVIIVEQNPDPNSISELNFIYDEKWSFKIKHTFTHQAGACNARNIALSQVESEWIFMADDDIRFEDFFLEKGIKKIKEYGVNAVTFNCFQKNEKPTFKNTFQCPTFGSGCSIVKAEKVKNIKFDIKFEFGFGEDIDFGMHIRNQGIDIAYFSEPSIFHLKAPIGGFRTKLILPWQNDEIQPKPSPTVMLYKMTHLAKQQQNGYKTNLFFKFYKVQSIKNPIRYFANFKKQWEQSSYWANKIKNT